MTLTIDTEPLPLLVDDEGVVRVGGTRVTLDTVVTAFNEGANAEEIVQQYPSISLADVYAVIGYYLRRQSDVDEYMQQRASQAEEVRQINETRFPLTGIRERLQARSSD
jgi:uncharacterized protein (DUF433 family)